MSIASESATSCPGAQTLISSPSGSWIDEDLRASAAAARASAGVRRTTVPVLVGACAGVCSVLTAGRPARMVSDRPAIVNRRERQADEYLERGVSIMGSISRLGTPI